MINIVRLLFSKLIKFIKIIFVTSCQLLQATRNELAVESILLRSHLGLCNNRIFRLVLILRTKSSEHKNFVYICRIRDEPVRPVSTITLFDRFFLHCNEGYEPEIFTLLKATAYFIPKL